VFNGLVKHDTLTGAAERYQFEPGVFCCWAPGESIAGW